MDASGRERGVWSLITILFAFAAPFAFSAVAWVRTAFVAGFMFGP